MLLQPCNEILLFVGEEDKGRSGFSRSPRPADPVYVVLITLGSGVLDDAVCSGNVDASGSNILEECEILS